MAISLTPINEIKNELEEATVTVAKPKLQLSDNYNVGDNFGSYKAQINPFQFMNTIRESVKKELEEEVQDDSKQIKRLANIVQGKILGFETGGTWNDIKHVNDEFVDFIFEGNEDKIKQLRAKFKRAARQQLNKLNDIKMPDLFDYTFKREVEKVMEEERRKALPFIRKIIQKQIREEVVQPWEAMAKLQGIDIGEIS